MLLVIGESGSRFEETGSGHRRSCGRSFGRPISARRSLFGSPDPAETKADLRRLSERLTIDACERWNFDFPAGKPIDGGRYEWESCDGKDARISSEEDGTVHQPPDSIRDDSDNQSRHPSERVTAERGSFVTRENSPDSATDDAKFGSPTIAKDDCRGFSRIRDNGDDATANVCASENISKRFQNTKLSSCLTLRRRGFPQIRQRGSSNRRYRSAEKALSSFVTDYFPKRKRSGGDCNRDSK